MLLPINWSDCAHCLNWIDIELNVDLSCVQISHSEREREGKREIITNTSWRKQCIFNRHEIIACIFDLLMPWYFCPFYLFGSSHFPWLFFYYYLPFCRQRYSSSYILSINNSVLISFYLTFYLDSTKLAWGMYKMKPFCENFVASKRKITSQLCRSISIALLAGNVWHNWLA